MNGPELSQYPQSLHEDLAGTEQMKRAGEQVAVQAQGPSALLASWQDRWLVDGLRDDDGWALAGCSRNR
jgi:hypothetical protein